MSGEKKEEQLWFTPDQDLFIDSDYRTPRRNSGFIVAERFVSAQNHKNISEDIDRLYKKYGKTEPTSKDLAITPPINMVLIKQHAIRPWDQILMEEEEGA